MRNPPAIQLTNKQFAAQDETFRKACELAALAATSRQASKYRNGRGLAFQFRAAATVELQRHFAANVVGGAR